MTYIKPKLFAGAVFFDNGVCQTRQKIVAISGCSRINEHPIESITATKPKGASACVVKPSGFSLCRDDKRYFHD